MCHFEQHEPAIPLYCCVTIYLLLRIPLLVAPLAKPLSIKSLLKLNHHQCASQTQSSAGITCQLRKRPTTATATNIVSLLASLDRKQFRCCCWRDESSNKGSCFRAFRWLFTFQNKVPTKESGLQVIKFSFSPFGILSSLFLIAIR